MEQVLQNICNLKMWILPDHPLELVYEFVVKDAVVHFFYFLDLPSLDSIHQTNSIGRCIWLNKQWIVSCVSKGIH